VLLNHRHGPLLIIGSDFKWLSWLPIPHVGAGCVRGGPTSGDGLHGFVRHQGGRRFAAFLRILLTGTPRAASRLERGCSVGSLSDPDHDVGNVVAIAQTNIKRIWRTAPIAHAGVHPGGSGDGGPSSEAAASCLPARLQLHESGGLRRHTWAGAPRRGAAGHRRTTPGWGFAAPSWGRQWRCSCSQAGGRSAHGGIHGEVIRLQRGHPVRVTSGLAVIGV